MIVLYVILNYLMIKYLHYNNIFVIYIMMLKCLCVHLDKVPVLQGTLLYCTRKWS